MRKGTLILSLVVVGMVASMALAGDSNLWFDARDNTTSAGTGVGGQLIAPGAPVQPYINGQQPPAGGGNSAVRFGAANTAVNGGARGAGGVLYLNPVQAGGAEHTANPAGSGSAWPNYDADLNSSTGRLWLYMDVNPDDAAGSGQVISSLGIDTNVSAGPLATQPRNAVGSLAFTMINDATVAAAAGGSPAAPWNGVVNGVQSGSAPNAGCPACVLSVTGSKGVRVPVTTGPTYAASLGMQPNVTGPYRVGRLDVVAGTRVCSGRQANAHVDNSTYTVKLSVNNLLITRVFQSGGDADEQVSFGYDPYAGSAAIDGAVSGSTAGNTSANPDAAIVIRLHGDFNGDGNVTGADVAGFNLAVAASGGGTATVAQMYLGDFNNSRSVTGGDVAGFNGAVAASGTCP